MINVTDKRARYFNVCETFFTNINSIVISISIFVVKRSNYELFLERFFQRAAYISSINMNDEFLKMILHSLNEKKQMNCLRMLTEYVNNKEE